MGAVSHTAASAISSQLEPGNIHSAHERHPTDTGMAADVLTESAAHLVTLQVTSNDETLLGEGKIG